MDWVDDLKVADLKVELKNRGLTVSGNKAVLIERLKTFLAEQARQAAVAQPAPNDATNTGSLTNDAPVTAGIDDDPGDGNTGAGDYHADAQPNIPAPSPVHVDTHIKPTEPVQQDADGQPQIDQNTDTHQSDVVDPPLAANTPKESAPADLTPPSHQQPESEASNPPKAPLEPAPADDPPTNEPPAQNPSSSVAPTAADPDNTKQPPNSDGKDDPPLTPDPQPETQPDPQPQPSPAREQTTTSPPQPATATEPKPLSPAKPQALSPTTDEPQLDYEADMDTDAPLSDQPTPKAAATPPAQADPPSAAAEPESKQSKDTAQLQQPLKRKRSPLNFSVEQKTSTPSNQQPSKPQQTPTSDPSGPLAKRQNQGPSPQGKTPTSAGTKADPPKPAVITPALRVEPFVRPLREVAVKELMASYGTVSDMWMPSIKTHCIVVFESEEIAEAAYNTMYDLEWQPGRKLRPRFLNLEVAQNEIAVG